MSADPFRRRPPKVSVLSLEAKESDPVATVTELFPSAVVDPAASVPLVISVLPESVDVPEPNWFTEPFPVIEAVSEAAFVWLKLMIPVPEPNTMFGTARIPAASLPPRPPILSVPDEPASPAMDREPAWSKPP